MSEEFKKYIEMRLSQWAEWHCKDNRYGIGYPSCSVEYRLMIEGFIPRNKYANQILPSHSEAEEMEKLIKEMSCYNRTMAQAIRCHYLSNGGLRIKAKRVEVSHMQFKYYVDMAHQWLAGRFSGMKKSRIKTACTVNTNHV